MIHVKFDDGYINTTLNQELFIDPSRIDLLKPS